MNLVTPANPITPGERDDFDALTRVKHLGAPGAYRAEVARLTPRQREAFALIEAEIAERQAKQKAFQEAQTAARADREAIEAKRMAEARAAAEQPAVLIANLEAFISNEKRRQYDSASNHRQELDATIKLVLQIAAKIDLKA